ncbi:MAG: family 20 glycosylhydrolase [Elusimicrobia bacterium]|nr:family 20 glycosylhydrolase [Elusimicrobiota bacterium]
MIAPALALTAFLAAPAGAQTRSAPDLLPIPARVSSMGGEFRLTPDFKVALEGPAPARLRKALARFRRRLSDRTGLRLAPETGPQPAALAVSIQRTGRLVLHEDETYGLEVSSSAMRLSARTDIGAIRGLETLLQLLDADANGYFFSAVRIEDKPRFPWRGLLMDVSRHFMPVEVLKRNIDGLAAVKMNVLHLHLSDYQGFRVECLSFPRLHEQGSDGWYYTQEQIREILAYADERGVRVVPEFDIPGHSTSWFVGYPELASTPGPYRVERRYGVFSSAFNPAAQSTYAFLDKFFAEMAVLFPDDYVHIGGDEVDGADWEANPGIRKFMKDNAIADTHELQAYFNQRLLAILGKYGKKMIGWDEILRPDMPKSIVIQSWQGRQRLAESAKNGFMGILSADYYIDIYKSAGFHYLNDPLDKESSLSEEERARVLGGEATMWSEFVTPENIDARVWPRTAAIAERLWSPAQVDDLDDMYRRLAKASLRLEELGLTHIKNYDMMLRRLAGGPDTAAVKTLADVLEPVKDWWRFSRETPYQTGSPYTRLVDAVAAESEVARSFAKLVDEFLADRKTGAQEIRARLIQWSMNDARFQPIARRSPILREALPLSANLSGLARAGLRSLDHIPGGGMDKALTRELMGLVDEARTDYGGAQLAVTVSVQKLVEAAARQP